jgi:hypothetical protein
VYSMALWLVGSARRTVFVAASQRVARGACRCTACCSNRRNFKSRLVQSMCGSFKHLLHAVESLGRLRDTRHRCKAVNCLPCLLSGMFSYAYQPEVAVTASTALAGLHWRSCSFMSAQLSMHAAVDYKRFLV